VSQALAIPEKHDGELADRSSVRIWLRLFSCTMTIEKIVQRRLTEQFCTTLPRFDVLAALERRPHGMAMGELSRALLVSNGNVTAIVQKLAKDGHVTIAPLPSDRRTQIVRLTQAGKSHFAALAKAHHDWIDSLLAGLHLDEREALYEGLGHLKRSLGEAARKETM
jgi:DNA-binding MarR family transcriptional regulator